MNTSSVIADCHSGVWWELSWARKTQNLGAQHSAAEKKLYIPMASCCYHLHNSGNECSKGNVGHLFIRFFPKNLMLEMKNA